MLVRLVVEQTFGETTTRRHGDWRQLNRSGVIAHRINTFHAGILEFIDDDVPFFVGFHAGGGKVNVVGCRFAANRPNQAIHRFAATVFQLQGQAAVGVFHHRFRDRVGVKRRAFRVHHFNQRFGDHRVKAA
ncbi:Uncharacterised protein [Citrobacter koseri]|uniref:Uncharacterized protein n=1 Tax=Citrobacter koseri TaxID=545 RepID=A0A447UML6_CITKO|nr:Uncharacterised protein [Citrobacter koseri]